MLPTAADLDDPDGFVHRAEEGGIDFDALDKLLGDAARGEDTSRGEGGRGTEGDQDGEGGK